VFGLNAVTTWLPSPTLTITTTKNTSTTANETNASTSCVRVDSATPRNNTTPRPASKIRSHTTSGSGVIPNSACSVSWIVPPIITRMPTPSTRMPT
jgi:hypothetical protein